jgi:hypothetical protein
VRLQEPLAYQATPGAFVPDERIDLIFQKFTGNYIDLNAILFTGGHPHSSFRTYTTEKAYTLTDYARDCLINALSNPASPTRLLGVGFRASDIDVAGQTFRGSFESIPVPFAAYVAEDQLISDWIPDSVRCGDKPY